MSPAPTDLLTGLLRDVSRSFHLTLRVLPGAIRPQIGLAYLLARATDTIADTEIVPVAQRLDALNALREAILETSQAGAAPALRLGELARHQGAPAERVLLERIGEALALLRQFTPADQERIRAVLTTITGGQELDLQRFGGADVQRIIALRTEQELDDYTYRVAGCVGEFWTRMCRAHVFPDAPMDDAALLVNGVRFGKGLQLVNIVRDLPADLRQGRCYLPAEKLSASGLVPADLLHAENEGRFRPLYDQFLALAQAHLAAGWDYTNALPRRCVRVRLACAWPVLIGVSTLARLRAENVLEPARRVKINRAEVRGLLARSLLCYPWPWAWQRLFMKAANEVA